ncbi:Tyrosine recombinase XerC [Paraburkholderia aspalathi]|uniref:tyrosine-type recombinase/integrase n=1 Tax=Paraburkholderia aspalathi TaxID=1324617 RepID=UPI00190BEAFF|nr:tyrosine-type recombinase/integrase [Paraburkholderia aspalathi]MBK3844405.1 tyrosine-type recombinase/integrase [Paraburkholderia aspalathi]CAE6824025.1 Tyrosine recombinase XerC [Paraburkholderia aspalathi]
MGRKRKNDSLGLPDRVYVKHGAFYYVHRDARWERLGTDLAEAKRKGNLYNDPDSTYGTTAYFLDEFVIHCEKRVSLGDLKPRTYEDYKKDVEPLKTFFGRMTPASIEPKHIGLYLDLCAENGRPVRGNREKACLSSCFTWLIRKGKGSVKSNPCLGVKRNKETKRERYVEHEEYRAVRALAARQVRGLLDLTYRTLQRPEDIILWGPESIVHKREPDGSIRRVIRNDQGKTGTTVDIAVTPEIDTILAELRDTGPLPGPGKTWIHQRNGLPYTYSGLCSMLHRYIAKANRLRQEKGLPAIESFGPYDMKAKGATDMWLAGVPLERIQALCGHDSITTTEIYVKCRWRGTVEPNRQSVLSN